VKIVCAFIQTHDLNRGEFNEKLRVVVCFGSSGCFGWCITKTEFGVNRRFANAPDSAQRDVDRRFTHASDSA
jgi:hypothetical protein